MEIYLLKSNLLSTGKLDFFQRESIFPVSHLSKTILVVAFLAMSAMTAYIVAYHRWKLRKVEDLSKLKTSLTKCHNEIQKTKQALAQDKSHIDALIPLEKLG